MTITSKIFWFFAICLVAKMVLPSTAAEQSVKEPVKYGKAEQCATSNRYLVILSYDGRPIEKAYFRCDNGQMISASKM